MVLGLGLSLALASGLSLGLIGGGGSIITVPMLVYVLGVSPHQAIGMSLAVVGATALVSVFSITAIAPSPGAPAPSSRPAGS
jgi:hypothetical protein